MAWFSGRVSLGNLDLAGAVNKLQESVKNIEKNFDSALGLEEKPDSNSEASGLWPSATDRKTLFDPVMALMGHKKEENVSDDDIPESSQYPIGVEDLMGNMESSEKLNVQRDNIDLENEKLNVQRNNIDLENEKLNVQRDNIDLENEKLNHSVPTETAVEDAEQFAAEGDNMFMERKDEISTEDATLKSEGDSELPHLPIETFQPIAQNEEESDSGNFPEKNTLETQTIQNTEVMQDQERSIEMNPLEVSTIFSDTCRNVVDVNVVKDEQEDDVVDKSEQKIHVNSLEKNITAEEVLQNLSIVHSEVTRECQDEHGIKTFFPNIKENESNHLHPISHPAGVTPEKTSESASRLDSNKDDVTTELVTLDGQINDGKMEVAKQSLSSEENLSDSSESVVALEKLKMEMKMMETALQGAARQAQAKADEIARLMNENEHLKSMIEDLKRKSNDAEIESLREEYHQRLATLERKAYALTKERDALKREQNKKSDSAALLKEKDEIINQVMAEGEELSKKQAAQESHIRKLRAQIRELEEEKKTFITKLQVEESKVDSIKRDKTATEQLLQETIEKHQNELASQKEYYTNALNAAKEAEALAEARANNEARTELERRLREAEERETMLVQTLEELRQTLSRKEQQVVFREDMLRRDIEDLQKRYQASERRCEELITQVPESTRPLIRQIEAMQETTARRAEAWSAVERSLNARLQEAEAKAAAAEEKERSVNDRLSQTLSRINVLEAQISCLRAEQAQLSKSLEKERQRAAEIRQELFATKEEADTHEGRANQLEAEIRELRQKHKQELQDALTHRELLQQEVDREKSARLDLEKMARVNSTSVADPTSFQKRSSTFENGNLTRELSSASSLGSMEESHFLQASLDSSDSLSDKRNVGEATLGPYYVKSITPSAFEAALRQKDGELSSYMSRLQSLESIRDSLAEELVKMTAQNEKFRAEATILPGLRAELDALRRRHSAALELMGERDEELEELRADIVDLKEMYREQVNLLVNKISSIDTSG